MTEAKPVIEDKRAESAASPDPAAELSWIDQLYRNRIRSRVGRAAPLSLTALLESRGVSAEIEDLVASTVEAVLALPETRRIEPGTLLTEEEMAILTEGGFQTELSDDENDPLSQGIAEYSSLIATSLKVAEVAERLHVNASRIRQRLGARSAYGFKLGTHWRLPRFQLAGQKLVPGIEQVIRSLPEDLHPVAVATWFGTPNPDLYHEPSDRPLTPLEWLRSGYDPQAAAELAMHL